jgi:hypothetical protein
MLYVEDGNVAVWWLYSERIDLSALEEDVLFSPIFQEFQ